MAIYDELAPRSVGATLTLNELGVVHYARKDLDVALSLFQRALDVGFLVAPGSATLATVLSNIAQVHVERKQYEQALPYLEQALPMAEQVPAGRVLEKDLLSLLGAVESARGNLDRALSCCERAFILGAEVAPKSLGTAASATTVGFLYLQRARSSAPSCPLSKAWRSPRS